MAYESLVGLKVTDQAGYQRYRDGMTPILAEYGGSFAYDFHIAETLQAENDADINRVFLIRFPDKQKLDAFFADDRYKAVRAEHFDSAVAQVTRMREIES